MSKCLSAFALCTMLVASSVGMAEEGHAKRPVGVSLAPLFNLKDQNGHPLVQAELRGKPFLVVFGYTNCPEVCPTSLFEASQLLDQLDSDGPRLRILFVTVDPERDTAEHLRSYLASFHPGIKGLTGSVDQVTAAAAAFGAPVQKGTAAGNIYSMNHSSQMYLMDRYGLLARAVPYNKPGDLAAVTRRLLAQ